MNDGVLRLAGAVATGTVGELAEAVDACAEAVWFFVDDNWRPVGLTNADQPDDRAIIVEAHGRRLALSGADEATVALARAGLVRIGAEHEKQAAESRLDLNERIAGVGSYDWNILEDTNDWSDELFRIYGHPPGAFNASYEKFMEMVHPDDRDRIRGVHEQAYGSGEPYEMEERIVRPDGSVRRLWSNGVVLRDADGTPIRMVGVCRDITDAHVAEDVVAEQRDRIQKAELLRQQALDVNDNIVQGLTAAVWALETDAPLVARKLAAETLQHARTMMHDLLSAADSPTMAGSLVRESAAKIGHGLVSPEDIGSGDTTLANGSSLSRCRVVLADDAEDLRVLLRMSIAKWAPGLEVVGEAADGVEAVAEVARLKPDVILLDLSMPRMDGLEACAKIKEAMPGTRVVILTGWGEETLGSQAREAGADAFVQKGSSIEEIIAVVEQQRDFAHH